MCNVNQDRVERPEKAEKFVPEYRGNLRDHMIEIPRCIAQASGIRVFGRRIKSLVFTTDVAIIRNINADAVIAVYPFTPQPAITRAVLTAAEMPVFLSLIHIWILRVFCREFSFSLHKKPHIQKNNPPGRKYRY